MVSNASDDLPEPDRPVNTTSWSRGIDTSTFLRLCSRAPRMVMARASRAFLLEKSVMEPCYAQKRQSERSKNNGVSPVPGSANYARRGDNQCGYAPQKAKGRRNGRPP